MGIRLIILAAGKGTRMKSQLPKVLHPLAGKPLLGHVIDTGLSLNAQGITVVIGHGADKVKDTITQDVQWAMQTEQLGTAHAVMQGLEGIQDDDTVLLQTTVQSLALLNRRMQHLSSSRLKKATVVLYPFEENGC